MALCKQLMELEEIDTLSTSGATTTAMRGRLVISAASKQVRNGYCKLFLCSLNLCTLFSLVFSIFLVLLFRMPFGFDQIRDTRRRVSFY